ncbi:hypothetical protein P691DRAFT_789193 [Macrolepiota fuliginosa MF-IS2]|uniref:WD40 repeat-like protein n=1 Tax=Macrolepiota fuliginosa MF-IS2 TaxID=1400762 RepID=A0A9P5X192_9AGAR|nr:hypothetical protein P691DRAFT_789193 [Macrolepiota fuliginosa MF-IS2]
MKGLVGDAVGNMSISPSSHDIVLAACVSRRIRASIDTNPSLTFVGVVRAIWVVANVQWNPHSQRDQYVASTSSEKLLIWNLLLVGKTSIEHVPSLITAQFTDIDWHTTECNTIASTSLDSWIYVWDLREPQWPIFDWSHTNRNKLVTCSKDKTTKTWDVNESKNFTIDDGGLMKLKSMIRMMYPVWRVLTLPFGSGVLGLPQRDEMLPEMYAMSNCENLVEVFEGHTDVVKEFVWRKGGSDRTLRFWPVDGEVLEVGNLPEPSHGPSRLSKTKNQQGLISYCHPPETQITTPPLSNPIGHRAIPAEVCAPLLPQRPLNIVNPNTNLDLVLSIYWVCCCAREYTRSAPWPTKPNYTCQCYRYWTGMSIPHTSGLIISTTSSKPRPISAVAGKDIERERGDVGGKSGEDGCVYVVGKYEGWGEEGEDWRMDGMRWVKDKDRDRDRGVRRGVPRGVITLVLTKLTASKIKLEKHDLAERQTCTLALHGPWGKRSSVFIRIMFTFPREYPQSPHPAGTPLVDIERSPLVSMKDRAFVLKRLRFIREHKRPCLEACLRFLSFGHEDEDDGEGGLGLGLGLGGRARRDGESSDEDALATGVGLGEKGKGKEVTVSLLRNHKNLAEPRTTQGTFGPNGFILGELICFFRAPPRLVRPVLENVGNAKLSEAASQQLHQQQQPAQQDEEEQSHVSREPSKSRVFPSPALLSDAVRRLTLAAVDRTYVPDPRKQRGDEMAHIMTDLLTLSRHNHGSKGGDGAHPRAQD